MSKRRFLFIIVCPAMVVFPFKETKPVPVENVYAPVCENLLSKDVAPCKVRVPGVVVEPMVSNGTCSTTESVGGTCTSG